jgi:glycosyltransferase involved in cell wall biosynthesis
VLVGDGPEREALVFLVDQLGLVDAVELTGSVPPDRVRELLDTAAVAVCSSRSEGTSNAVLEAMALGIPVVSTRASQRTVPLVASVVNATSTAVSASG